MSKVLMIYEKKVTTPIEIEEPPRELTYKNVIYWSEHFKRLEGTEHGKGIQTKAKLFLKKGLIQYDPDGKKYSELGDYENHKFICKPIRGYNSTIYRMWWDKSSQRFICSCQFNQTTKIDCSHVTALWMQIKIWNWRK